MIGQYSAAMLRRYVMQQTGINPNTWTKHAKRFPPASPGPGGTDCYTEEQVVEILNYWAEWWRVGRGGGTRDHDKVLFPELGKPTEKAICAG